MLTHEFRTSLTQIDAQAQRLISLKDRLRAEDIVERAGRVRVAVARIVRLIDNLVDSSRRLDGDTDLLFRTEPIDLATVLQNACGRHRKTSPGVELVEYYGARPLLMRGNSKMLLQVFSNIIANAIKYVPDGAKVVLRAEQTDKGTFVIVEDQGVGIVEQDSARIFTHYYCSNDASGSNVIGVGLFVVATAVHLHGGDIAVESGEGKGYRFTVILPNGLAPAALHDGATLAHRLEP